jgi:hypothetical protein
MHFAGPFMVAPFEPAIVNGVPVPGRAGAPIVPSRVAIFSFGDTLEVAVVDASGQIRTFTISASDLEAGHASQTAFPEPALRNSSGSVVTTDSDLSLSVIGLDRATFPGTGRHLALYYVDRTGGVRRASKEFAPVGNFTDRGAVRDASGAPLVTVPGNSPAVAGWTHLGSLDDLELFMVLQRPDARFKLYRYDRANNRWGDVTQAVFNAESVEGPGHNQKMAFWFQPILDANGEIIERGKGFSQFSFAMGPDRPAPPRQALRACGGVTT